jgi:hypothetical protein
MLIAYNDSPPVVGGQPTIQFDDGVVSGTTGCNHYGGSYQIEGDAITFGDLFRTEIACSEPEGVMDQERVYFDLLASADRFTVSDGVLTIFAAGSPILTFEEQADPPSESGGLGEEVVEPGEPGVEPPADTIEYRDAYAGISITIPATWVVNSVVRGQGAIFQSYPTDKYVGGEELEPGDTKCDLTIHPLGSTAADLVGQIISNPENTVVSNERVALASGLAATRLHLEGCWWASVALVTELNDRAVVFSCFGDEAPFEGLAGSLVAFEPDGSALYGAAEGIKEYADSETGVTITFPATWVVSASIPGQRATLQSFAGTQGTGGEMLEQGDTRCELFITDEYTPAEFIDQMKSNQAITILAEDAITLESGLAATRVEMESLERSMMLVTEINGLTVLLTCSGDFSLFDEIAGSLRSSE